MQKELELKPAEVVANLILDWMRNYGQTWKGAKEPVLTCDLTKAELEQFRDTPMDVPYYPLHTQGIERAVKEVTGASEAVYGFERREGFIRTRAENRKLMPAICSKKMLQNLLQ